MADHRDWTTDDFCAQCATFASGYMIKRQEIIEDICIDLNTGNFSACAFCRFWYATLYPGGISPNDDSTVELRAINILPVLSYKVSEPIRGRLKSLRGAFVIPSGGIQSSTDEGHFLIPLPPQRDMEWPGTTVARDPIYRGAGDQWDWPFRSPQTASVDMKMLCGWITGCRTQHVKRCPEPTSDLLTRITSLPGFNLIDCVTRRIVQAPKVCEYVALSYVWGQPSVQVVDDSVSGEQAAGTLPKILPDTVKDSIIITLNLGLRYLWVDKYCINQGMRFSELQAQLAAMDVIYHCATITIIAAAGEDATFGLPGVSSRLRKARPHITVNGTTWVSGFVDAHKLMQLSTWATRGWVSEICPLHAEAS